MFSYTNLGVFPKLSKIVVLVVARSGFSAG